MAWSRTRKRDPGVWAYCGRWSPFSSSCDERVAGKEPDNVLYTEDLKGKNGFYGKLEWVEKPFPSLRSQTS